MTARPNKFSSAAPKPQTPEAFAEAAPVATVTDIQSLPKAIAAEKDQVYKSVTLRLTKERYKALKMLSTTEEASIQDLLTKALDDLLAKSRS